MAEVYNPLPHNGSKKEWCMLGRILLGTCAAVLSFGSFAAVTVSSELQTKLDRLHLLGSEHVLQYGGTPADVYAVASRLPKVLVVAVSQASETDFHSKNIQKTSGFKASDLFDHIVVEEALTKEYKQQNLIQTLQHQLKSDGKMVLHLPDYQHGVIARVLVDTWMDLRDFNVSSPKHLSYSAEQYQNMLVKSGLKVASESRQTNSKQFKNKQALSHWLSNHWAYCQDMTASDKALFIDVFVDNFIRASHQSAANTVNWEQSFLSIEAQKV